MSQTKDIHHISETFAGACNPDPLRCKPHRRIRTEHVRYPRRNLTHAHKIPNSEVRGPLQQADPSQLSRLNTGHATEEINILRLMPRICQCMWKTKVELAEEAKRRGKEAEKTAQQNTRLYPSKRGQKFGCQVNMGLVLIRDLKIHYMPMCVSGVCLHVPTGAAHVLIMPAPLRLAYCVLKYPGYNAAGSSPR